MNPVVPAVAVVHGLVDGDHAAVERDRAVVLRSPVARIQLIAWRDADLNATVKRAQVDLKVQVRRLLVGRRRQLHGVSIVLTQPDPKGLPARHVSVDHPRVGAVDPLYADNSASRRLAETRGQDGAPGVGVDAHRLIDAPRRLIALHVTVLAVDDFVQRAEVVAESVGLAQGRHQLRFEHNLASAAPQLLDVAAAGCKRPLSPEMSLIGDMGVGGT
ncbi:MAG: hypothetical protein AUI21_06890 [Nitrospirae bacterium 13_1_40CM_2_62_10]|nr:MAG: hypothetical protein AUI21_06890 [Nitrospirae bacterium 13_1_40CM_2_62_10]